VYPGWNGGYIAGAGAPGCWGGAGYGWTGAAEAAYGWPIGPAYGGVGMASYGDGVCCAYGIAGCVAYGLPPTGGRPMTP
jgi:hypothetical protein